MKLSSWTSVQAKLRRVFLLNRNFCPQKSFLYASLRQFKLNRLLLYLDLTAKAADRRFVLDTYGPIAFSSVVTPFVLEHMHDNDGVVFDKVLTNFGGSYLNDSGIFTVPIAGIYLFTSSMLDSMQKGHHGDVLVHGEIVRNNHTLVRVYARAETGYRDQGANMVLVNANVGDQFWVRVVDNNDLGLGGQLYTSFSGVLLW